MMHLWSISLGTSEAADLYLDPQPVRTNGGNSLLKAGSRYANERAIHER